MNGGVDGEFGVRKVIGPAFVPGQVIHEGSEDVLRSFDANLGNAVGLGMSGTGDSVAKVNGLLEGFVEVGEESAVAIRG